MGKIRNETNKKQRHNPLMKDITSQGGNLRENSRGRTKAIAENDNEEYIDAASSRRILQLAKAQQDEIDEEGAQPDQKTSETFGQQWENVGLDDELEDEEYSDFEDNDNEPLEEFEEEVAIDAESAQMFEKYFASSGPNNGSFNLADKIMAKLEESAPSKEVETRPDAVLLPPKVIAAYEKVGQILSTYTHGKLPKLFKVLPTLRNWEDVLFVTNPEAWTPHAVYEATKLFVSNLQANEAQKFIEQVLLERVRTAIEDSEDHTLNYHLYRAIKKSLYKPGAFFKGFLLPLVDSHCSVREATITASVLAKVSVPALHSSVALSQLLQRDFTPATIVFIRVLIEKKYALPYQTLDELVFYFMRFRKAAQNPSEMDTDEDGKQQLPKLPVVWHKAFLAFAQRYKNDITDDQRDFLLETVRQQYHHAIGPEIRRELLAGQPRVTGNTENAGKDALMMEAF